MLVEDEVKHGNVVLVGEGGIVVVCVVMNYSVYFEAVEGGEEHLELGFGGDNFCRNSVVEFGFRQLSENK